MAFSGARPVQRTADRIDLLRGPVVAASYSKLRVWDANGSQVEARMSVAGKQVVIELDDTGASYPITVDPLVSISETRLSQGVSAAGDEFGTSVDVKNGRIAAGSPLSSTNEDRDGKVLVFDHNGVSWDRTVVENSVSPKVITLMGHAVAWRSATEIVASKPAPLGPGFVSLLTEGSPDWSNVTIATGTPGGFFGGKIAASGDYALVGAADEAAGEAYILEDTGSGWTKTLFRATQYEGGKYGSAVGLSGNVAVVGAPNVTEDLMQEGRAYIFRNNGGNWLPSVRVAGDDSPSEHFGTAAATDGTRVVITATGTDAGGFNAGGAFVFSWTGSTWQRDTVLTPSDGINNQNFGDSVAIDGDTIAVGSVKANGGAGAVYLYHEEGGVWVETKVSASDGVAGDDFGNAVSVEGNLLVVGAKGAASDAGAAYVFELRLSDGLACTDDAECASGFCTDGVCCDQRCDGSCTVCSASLGATADGACSPLAETTECAPAACADTVTALSARTCNATGECQMAMQTPCGAYTCDNTAAACRTSCSDDPDCASGHVCEMGACVAILENGVACDRDEQCQSGFCADGVCCDSVCDGVCQSCLESLTGSAVGTCANVRLGEAEPDAACPADGAPCGADGTCDGAGACATVAVSGKSCGPNQCQGSGVATQACDGAGTCAATLSTMCAPYGCDSAAADCRTECIGDGDCAPGNVCEMGACVGTREDGVACSRDEQCQSGFCTEGVCCDSTCTEVCQSCLESLTGAATGTCSNVTLGTLEPAGRCSDDGTSCGADGTCDGAGSCATVAVSGKSCGPDQCDGTSVTEQSCDGAGACVSTTTKACAPYACDTSAGDCKTACSSDDDCASGNPCNTSTQQCVEVSSSCKDATTVEQSDGTEIDCAPYVCETGSCTSSCDSTADCASGNVCADRECVAGSDSSSSGGDDSGCGCRVPRDGGRSPGWLLPLLGLLLLRRQRKNALISAAPASTSG